MATITTSSRRRTGARPCRCPPRGRANRCRRLDRKRRRRLTRKARAARYRLQRLHQALPRPARSLFDALAGGFTRPTFLRWVVLVVATILTVGGRTVCNLLRTLGVSGRSKPATDGRLKTSHFEETQNRHAALRVPSVLHEAYHVEPAQSGHDRDYSVPGAARLVPTPHGP